LKAVSADVIDALWRELLTAGTVIGASVPLELLERLMPVVEALLRERIASVGDLRGEIID
jgi:hypothetical protein